MQSGFKLFIIIFIIGIGVFAYYSKDKKISFLPSGEKEAVQEIETNPEIPKKIEEPAEIPEKECVSNCTKNFTDPDNIFSFDYNTLFQSFERYQSPTTFWSLNSQKNGTLLATVIIPKTFLPNTNFSDARFTVGRATDSWSIKNCLNKTLSSYTEGGVSLIDGYFLKKFTFNDAGAGNLYDSVSYRGIVDGDCYALEYTIHSTNILNYSPEQGIKEFDKTKIQNEIYKMIKSFKFLINSD